MEYTFNNKEYNIGVFNLRDDYDSFSYSTRYTKFNAKEYLKDKDIVISQQLINHLNTTNKDTSVAQDDSTELTTCDIEDLLQKKLIY